MMALLTTLNLPAKKSKLLYVSQGTAINYYEKLIVVETFIMMLLALKLQTSFSSDTSLCKTKRKPDANFPYVKGVQ